MKLAVSPHSRPIDTVEGGIGMHERAGAANLFCAIQKDTENHGLEGDLSESSFWTGCRPFWLFPMPSTVTTWCPSIAHSGVMHAFTARCTTFPSV